MKRVKISSLKIGLIYKNENFNRVTLEGSHWLGFNETIRSYDRLKIYETLPDMELVSKNKVFSENTCEINVRENEIALIFVRNHFNQVLTTGSYFYFKGNTDIQVQIHDLNSTEEITSIDTAILRKQSVIHHVAIYKIESYEKGLLFQNGKYIKELSGGSFAYWLGSKSLELLKIDLRNTQMDISGQELLTKDKAAVRINFQLEYRVTDCFKALLENKDYLKQLYSKGQLALREFIGTLTLDELLESKEKVATSVLGALQPSTDALGVSITDAGIRDIILPGEVREIMNQVLIAEKRAQVNVIARREETASTRTMLNTAKLMEENEVLMKLKEMEYIEKIADKIGEIKLSSGSAVIDQLAKILTK